jgi:isopentenyldiphosphate isomerase
VPKSVKGAVSKAAARKSLWVRVPPRALVDRANSPDELLDLVDEHDRVIGTVRHGAADGDPGLIHREVAIVIHRGDELLWQLRSAAKRVLPLTWDFACAGHVGAGDEPASAAHRELLEELGFDTELRVLERRLVREPNETHFAYLFAGSVPEGVEPRPDPDEVAAIEWWDEPAFRRRVAEGEAISATARDVAEAFWAGRWALRR